MFSLIMLLCCKIRSLIEVFSAKEADISDRSHSASPMEGIA